MRDEIRERLQAMSDTGYREFSASLIPASGRMEMLGVRLPALRKYAKELSKGDWRAELACAEDIYLEETMLRGMVLGCACRDVEELLKYLTDFIPRIRNWSVCDSVCSGLKLAEKYPREVWDFLQPYLYSGEEFPARFALVMLLNHYVKLTEGGGKIARKRAVTMADLQEAGTKASGRTSQATGTDSDTGQQTRQAQGLYLEEILRALDREFPEGYYAQMAAAWLIAELFAVYPARTYRALKELRLDAFTRRKAVQKIRESLIPDKEVKEHLKRTILATAE